ncbi:hypothetical protein ACFU5O_04175 [Streptomyces sp. NPDC057445]|uniref:hypothetical protein n=1 Tax=Streptomyces sp. NPDC057445 TaxID=3346136 RepID=UPI0036954F89
MRSVPIALRVVAAAAGVLMLAPAAGPVFAEDDGQTKAAVSPGKVGPGGEDEGQDLQLDLDEHWVPDKSQDQKKDEGQDEKKDPKKDWDQKKDEGQDEKKDPKKDWGQEKDQKKDANRDQKKDEDRDKDQNRDQGPDRKKDEREDRSPAPEPEGTPYAPVRAGGGGASAALADEDGTRVNRQGPGTPHTVIGLLLAAVAAVAVAFRSARRRRVDTADRD